MRMTMLRCVVTSVVEKFVLRAIRALVNVGYPVWTANGQLHRYNYLVDTPKIMSLGELS